LGVKILKTYTQLPKRRWKGQIPSFHKVRRYLPSAMKRRIILVLILALVLSTTIGYAYASKVVEDTHKEIEKLQYAGIFEDIGKAIGEAVDDTISSVTKAIGETLEELIKYTVNKFKDVKVSDWFIETVSKLVGRGGIDGYPDGTFRPNNTITRAEFTKILVSTLGHENLPKTGSHWASGYITKAEEIKLIGKGELKEIDKPITRNEMAKMAANALDYLGESHNSDRDKFKSQIKDFNQIPKAYQDYVLKSYSKGIITGYPDGTFKGNQGLTRAEASTVIIRIIDKDERVNVNQGEDKDFIEPEFSVRMTTNEKYTFNYFEFIVKNYQDYLDKDYTFITECISHPELNKRLIPYLFEDGYFESDQIQKFTIKSSRLINQLPAGKIYELETFDHDLNPKTNKPFKLRNGEKLKYKVTVTNGKATKTYELEAVFKDKKFY